MKKFYCLISLFILIGFSSISLAAPKIKVEYTKYGPVYYPIDGGRAWFWQ